MVQGFFKIPEKLQSYISMVMCILLWAFIPVCTKKLLLELNNIQILFYSTFFSLLLMFIAFLFKKEKMTLICSYSVREYLIMAFLGFLGTYLYYVFLYGALSLTSAQEGFILNYTWPILVILLAAFILKEGLTIKKILAILVSFFGIVFIVTKGKPFSFSISNLQGDIYAILAALCWAFFSVLGKKFKFERTLSLLVYFLSGFVFAGASVFVFSSFKLFSLTTFFWLLVNALFLNGITYFLWFKALDHGETHIISNSLYVTPFISLLYIYFFLKEEILLSSFIGLIIIILGIFIQSSNLALKKQ